MKNLYGITGIQVEAIDCTKNHLEELNEFLEEHDGDILEIQTVAMLYGVTRYVVIYKAS